MHHEMSYSEDLDDAFGLQNHSALCIQHYELKRFQVFGEPGAYSMDEQLPYCTSWQNKIVDEKKAE